MNNEPPPDDRGPKNDDGYLVYSVSDDESCSSAVIRGVAIATNCDPLTMEPLGRSVDPGAIDALFGHQSERVPDSLSFTFFGREIVVTPTRVYVRRD